MTINSRWLKIDYSQIYLLLNIAQVHIDRLPGLGPKVTKDRGDVFGYLVSFDRLQGLFVEVAGVQTGLKVAFVNQEFLESLDFRVISQAKVKVSFKGLNNLGLKLV